MIKRAPAEVYVRYLLCHPDGYNDEAVKQQVEDLELYCPEDQLGKLRRKYKPPTPFYPRNRKHEPSMRFLRDAGIYSLFFPDQSTKYALAIVNNNRVRDTVEQFLSQDASPQMVVSCISKTHGFACSVDGINKYKHIFYSDESTRSEKQQALDIVLHGWAKSPSKSTTAVHLQAEKWAARRSPRRTAITLPTCTSAQFMIAVQNGHMPKEAQYSMGNTMQSLALMLLHYANMKLIEGGPNAAREASDAMSALHRLHELIAQSQSANELALREIEQLHIRTDTSLPATIKALTQGNCTVDLQPIVKPEADAVESDVLDAGEQEDHG